MRPVVMAVLAAALTLLAVATPSAAGGSINTSKPIEGSSPDVRIDKCQFWSGVLRVPVGTVVTWTNVDVFPHVISGINWGRTDPMLTTGGTFSHTFVEAGIYPYTCTLHPGMSAVVFVGDVAEPATPVTKTADGSWLAAAILAATLLGVTGFAAGRYLGK
jgi:plastocyanin